MQLSTCWSQAKNTARARPGGSAGRRLWMDTRLGEGWEKEETPAGSIVSADSVTMVSSLTVTLEHLCPAL